MNYRDKILFSSIFDIKGQFLIIKGISHRRYRPRIELSIDNNRIMIFLYYYLNKYLPSIHIKHVRKTILTIDDNKNVLPLLLYIKDYIQFNKKEVELLIKFIYHRIELNKKRYDEKDEEFYKLLKTINHE